MIETGNDLFRARGPFLLSLASVSSTVHYSGGLYGPHLPNGVPWPVVVLVPRGSLCAHSPLMASHRPVRDRAHAVRPSGLASTHSSSHTLGKAIFLTLLGMSKNSKCLI